MKLSDVQGLTFIDETKPILTEHQELREKAYKVNRSVREFCNLYEAHLREERETLKMTYECMQKFCAMPSENKNDRVVAGYVRKYSIRQFWIDILLLVLMMVIFVACFEWMCFTEEYLTSGMH